MSGIVYKSKEEIHLMRKSNRAARKILNRLAEHVAPGITTGELDICLIGGNMIQSVWPY